MSHQFSLVSRARLKTCDERLQAIADVAIRLCPIDFMVLEGHRSIERQQEMFAKGTSKIDGVTKKGNHNYTPSRAMDLAPYPVDWEDRERFFFLAGFVLAVAELRGVRLRWGGNWAMDGDFSGNRFDDLPHFELAES